MHMAESPLKTRKIASGIYGRHEDFVSGQIKECYLVHNNKAIVEKSDVISNTEKDELKRLIEKTVEKLRT